ncbi:MAG TPA: L,D-transpeptidase family protein [Stellaceae bacterium]|nr:L,D-transpeptidase family protein [Stellaceae bacterium]
MTRDRSTLIWRVAGAALSPWVIALSILVLAPPALAAPGASEIKDALEDNTHPLSAGGFRLNRDTLTAAYHAHEFEPVWTAPEMTAAFVAALADAGREGLDPESFDLSAVKSALAGSSLTPVDRELLLTDRFLAYAQVLAQGEVSPSAVEDDWLLPRPGFEPDVALGALAQSKDVHATLTALLPSVPDYDRLRQMLEHYKVLAAAGSWQPIVSERKIEPGQKGDIVKTLRARLAAEGDLDPAQARGDAYDPTAVAAMKHFQTRHGLDPDGRVGAGTLAALNVSAGDRVQQIKLTLERWREMPRTYPQTRIVVNAAAAELTLYRDGEPALTSRVVVGDPDHPTPVLSARVVSALFNPPWNVPASITKKEIAPKLKQDPGYLARNHYVYVGSRLQQTPGPWNALGGVKFELPNPLDVYLHDTPAKPLFNKPVRAASHGCVRVQQARPLASILLGENWPAEAVDQAIAAGETKRVFLKTVVPVYLVYLTTFTDDDGTAEFRDDVYGRDQALADLLADHEIRRRIGAGPGAS